MSEMAKGGDGAASRRIQFARDAASVKPGELVPTDERGRTVTPRAMALARAQGFASIVAVGTGAGLLLVALGIPMWAQIPIVFVLLYAGCRYVGRSWTPMLEAQRRIVAGDIEVAARRGR